jgi:hypothetical protein
MLPSEDAKDDLRLLSLVAVYRWVDRMFDLITEVLTSRTPTRLTTSSVLATRAIASGRTRGAAPEHVTVTSRQNRLTITGKGRMTVRGITFSRASQLVASSGTSAGGLRRG